MNMANDPSTTPGKPAEMPKPQRIPLSKIHDLPGTIIPKPCLLYTSDAADD